MVFVYTLEDVVAVVLLMFVLCLCGLAAVTTRWRSWQEYRRRKGR